MANLPLFSVILLLNYHLSQATHPNTNQTHNGFSLRLHDRGSLTSQPNISLEEKLERLIDLFEAQAHFLEHNGRDSNSTLSRANFDDQVIRPALDYQFRQDRLFQVQLGIGTFDETPTFKTYYLELDTGGGKIWTQCEGCNPCFEQRDPYFPWSDSESYYVPPCDRCSPDETCELGHCMFDSVYGDGGHYRGIIATETFTFGTNTVGNNQKIKALRFGCETQAVKHVPRPRGDKGSGVFGMSRSPDSFISQVGERFRGRFSYCLTPMEYRGQQPPMFLRFGDDIPPLNSLGRQRTPLIRGPHKAYYVDLRGISIGSTKLDISSSVFRLREGDSITSGCILDTGFSGGRIIDVAYREFTRLLIQEVQEENPGIKTYSRQSYLCFRQPTPGTRATFPKVTYHLADDVDFVIEPEAYMYGLTIPNPRDYCLTISSGDTRTVIGAFQQTNYRFIYDTMRDELQFAPTDCLSSN